MPILTINLPPQQYKRVKKRARAEGFKTPMRWAQFLVERQLAFEESSKLKTSKIISEMRKTGQYKISFLRELERSLEYADKTDQ